MNDGDERMNGCIDGYVDRLDPYVDEERDFLRKAAFDAPPTVCSAPSNVSIFSMLSEVFEAFLHRLMEPCGGVPPVFQIVGIITRHNLTHEYLVAKLRQHYITIWGVPLPTYPWLRPHHHTCPWLRPPATPASNDMTFPHHVGGTFLTFIPTVRQRETFTCFASTWCHLELLFAFLSSVLKLKWSAMK